MKFKPLPIDVADFEKIREQGYYYVDKTLLIKELLDMKGEMNLLLDPGDLKNVEFKYASMIF